MATAKKTASSATKKSTAQKSTQGAKKAAKKSTRATAGKATGEQARERVNKARAERVAPTTDDLEFTFKPKLDGRDSLRLARRHAEKSLEELETAFSLGAEYVGDRFDELTAETLRQSAQAYATGKKWVDEHPVLASVAASAAVSAVLGAVSATFKRK